MTVVNLLGNDSLQITSNSKKQIDWQYHTLKPFTHTNTHTHIYTHKGFISLVPRLTDLFSVHQRKRGSRESNVMWVTEAPYIRVGRVADCEKASHIFKRSSSTLMEDMVPKPSSKCHRILEGLKRLCLINWSYLKSTIVDRPSFMTTCQHLSCDVVSQAPLFLSCPLKKIGEPGDEARVSSEGWGGGNQGMFFLPPIILTLKKELGSSQVY